jgi:Family of unknown function (DUF6174)
MRPLLVTVLLGLALVLVPSGSATAASDEVDPSIADGSAQKRLDAARQTWRAHGPRSYGYRAQLYCFCTADSVRPHDFVVRGRRPVHPPKHFRELATAWRLFKLVQWAIDHKVDGLRVEYRANGSLKTLDVDQYVNAADDEYSYAVTRFHTLR